MTRKCIDTTNKGCEIKWHWQAPLPTSYLPRQYNHSLLVANDFLLDISCLHFCTLSLTGFDLKVWLTEFRIEQILIVLQKGYFCMFKQVHSGWPKAIRSIRNSVSPGPMDLKQQCICLHLLQSTLQRGLNIWALVWLAQIIATMTSEI